MELSRNNDMGMKTNAKASTILPQKTLKGSPRLLNPLTKTPLKPKVLKDKN
jgi:hypothetical protein